MNLYMHYCGGSWSCGLVTFFVGVYVSSCKELLKKLSSYGVNLVRLLNHAYGCFLLYL